MDSKTSIGQIDPVQLSYATLLVWLVSAGFGAMSVLFLLYATGWVPAKIPIEEVPNFWTMDAPAYAEAAGVATGWQRVYGLDSEFLALIGTILFPTSATIAALAAAALFARHRVVAYALISLAEAVVLVIAASGIFAGA